MNIIGKSLVRSAAIAIVCYSSACVAAPIKLNNGVIYETDLKEVKLIADLRSDIGQKFVLLAGRDCMECDENTSLYIAYIGDKTSKIQVSKKRNYYPGNLKDYETGDLVQKTRTFYGQCLQSRGDSIVWFEEYKNDNGQWIKGEYRLTLKGVSEIKNLFHDTQPDLAIVLAAVEARKCHELTGIDGTTEPLLRC